MAGMYQGDATDRLGAAMRWVALFAMGLMACSKPSKPDTPSDSVAQPESEPESAPEPESGGDEHVADVTSVRVSGEPNAYTFAVTVRSPDTGCDRYANWWEVVAEDESLVYRRILRPMLDHPWRAWLFLGAVAALLLLAVALFPLKLVTVKMLP